MKKQVSPYSIFSRYYDALTASHQEARCNQLYGLAKKYGCKSLCDFACGTGRLMKYFHDRDIQVFGCDISKEMVRISSELTGLGDTSGLCVADMVDFKPPQRVDMATCNFDSINYLENPELWQSFFNNVFKALNPGGIFIFDFITEHDLMHNWPGHLQTIKRKNWSCTRLASYDEASQMGYEEMHWFLYRNNRWYNKTEIHKHVSFNPNRIKEMLSGPGFIGIKMKDFDTKKKVDLKNSVRIAVIARRK
jgi:SAM-dependent methyltransferase